MEKTLNLPDELAERLVDREDQLARILELGLEIVEHEAGEPETDEGDELPSAWQDALGELMAQRRQAEDEPVPTTEELIAYHRREIEPGERERWLEQLTLHPEAVQDLADLIELDREEAPNAHEAEATAKALRDFRARLGRPPSAPRRPRWLALAAVLAVAVGASMFFGALEREPEPAEPRYAAVIDVALSRGARSFPVSESAEEILLILPFEVMAQQRQGSLRITAADGDLIYRENFQAPTDSWSRLYVSLPREQLEPGSYRIEVTAEAGDAQPRSWEYRFALEAPAQR